MEEESSLPIARWGDLVLPWEIPRKPRVRFEFYWLHRRIADLEMEIYDLPYKPLPDELSHWGDRVADE